jgi:hypothetical protein
VHSKVLQQHKEQMEALQSSETCSSRAFWRSSGTHPWFFYREYDN